MAVARRGGRSVSSPSSSSSPSVAPAGSVSDFLISVRPLLRSRPSVRPSCDFHHSGGFLFIVSEGGGRARAIYLSTARTERVRDFGGGGGAARAAGVNFCSTLPRRRPGNRPGLPPSLPPISSRSFLLPFSPPSPTPPTIINSNANLPHLVPISPWVAS